ncbi:MAG: palindromic element RPE1 domain-containing protein [Rickettsia sp.]|jgi:RPE1 domain-containing protein|nr:palindromic element RPE1 domain-containing protein [Rickettsia sp.]
MACIAPFRKVLTTFNRPLLKLAYAQGFVGDTSPQTVAYSNVREDSSLGSTHKLPTEVEFRKSNVVLFIATP